MIHSHLNNGGDGIWKYLSWDKTGLSNEMNIGSEVDDKYIHGSNLDKSINKLLERNKNNRYRRYIYLSSPRYEKAEDYISEMRRLGLVYDAYTYNCGWIAIRALYQGEWGKKREKLYNMLWYVNWKENLEYMRTVIPQKAFPRLARIYKKKRRHL